jgi:hypothetical protein
MVDLGARLGPQHLEHEGRPRAQQVVPDVDRQPAQRSGLEEVGRARFHPRVRSKAWCSLVQRPAAVRAACPARRDRSRQLQQPTRGQQNLSFPDTWRRRNRRAAVGPLLGKHDHLAPGALDVNVAAPVPRDGNVTVTNCADEGAGSVLCDRCLEEEGRANRQVEAASGRPPEVRVTRPGLAGKALEPAGIGHRDEAVHERDGTRAAGPDDAWSFKRWQETACRGRTR